MLQSAELKQAFGSLKHKRCKDAAKQVLEVVANLHGEGRFYILAQGDQRIQLNQRALV